MPKTKSDRANRTVEASVSPQLKQQFSYWCSMNNISKRAAAGEAIQLFLDYKNHNFKQLQDHENSPLWVKLNQILAQEELNGQLTHELTQTISALTKVLLGGDGQLNQTDIGGHKNND